MSASVTEGGGGPGHHEGVYTPEAVRVDLPIADVGSRTLSIIIDLVVMLTLLYVVLLLAVGALGVALSGAGTDAAWPVVVLVLLLNFLVLWGYPVGCETLFGGRTAGKAALGLRVVTLEGAPVRFRHAAIRGLFAFLDFYLLLGIPALITALVTRRAQRLGDLAAGTVVVKDRGGQAGSDQPVWWQVPPALQGYATTLDVRGLGAGDYALVRRFLLRAGDLRPEHRARVATDLANALAQRMRHQPPPGTHPEALLLCVAALMQRGPGAGPQRPGPQSPGPQGPGGAPPGTGAGWAPAYGPAQGPPDPSGWAMPG